MRTLFLLALLLISTLPATAQLGGEHPDPRTISPPYATSFVVVGRVVDADGNFAAKYPVTITVQGTERVVGQETVFTNCYGDFDVYFEHANLSDRWSVRVVTGGQTREQAVDVLHRRNDFAIKLDRSLPHPPESDANCRASWEYSHNRESFTGQLLHPTPPYKGPMGNTLIAKPQNGVLITVKWVRPDGTFDFPKVPLYTNEQGAYKYSLTNEIGGPPPAGYVLVWFEDDPSQVTNVTLGNPTHYNVVSRPPVRVTPPIIDTPALAPLGAVAALALAVLVARRR